MTEKWRQYIIYMDLYTIRKSVIRVGGKLCITFSLSLLD
jgi:hypothetical protein